MTSPARYDEWISLPKAVRLPIEMIPPGGFDPAQLATWPAVVGRLEFSEGKLWYMPPCGDKQQDTVADVVIVLGTWVRSRPGFVLATNEAGMHLAGATRAADAAIWRRDEAVSRSGGLRRTPPVLAVEVTGDSENEADLVPKASWYLSVGVALVWIVVPEARRVVVVTAEGSEVYGSGRSLPEHTQLPGLAPAVDELFFQLDQR